MSPDTLLLLMFFFLIPVIDTILFYMVFSGSWAYTVRTRWPFSLRIHI